MSQLGNAAQCLTCSMCQFEALGASSLLKLLVTHLWTLFWTVLFICVTWLDSFLLPTKICSVLDVKPRLSRQRVLSQLKTKAQCLAYSMREFEALGVSSSRKLLAADLWTLFWSILVIRLMWSNSNFLSLKICLVLDVKSHLSCQHTLSQLETTEQFSTHTTYDV